MARTIFLRFSKGHNSETKKEGTIILAWDTLCWPNVHFYKAL